MFLLLVKIQVVVSWWPTTFPCTFLGQTSGGMSVQVSSGPCGQQLFFTSSLGGFQRLTADKDKPGRISSADQWYTHHDVTARYRRRKSVRDTTTTVLTVTRVIPDRRDRAGDLAGKSSGRDRGVRSRRFRFGFFPRYDATSDPTTSRPTETPEWRTRRKPASRAPGPGKRRDRLARDRPTWTAPHSEIATEPRGR